MNATVIPFEPAHRPEPEGFAKTKGAWLSRWQSDPRLSLSDRALITQIFLHFNYEHFENTGDLAAWPSWQTLMDVTGLKRSCVHKSLRKLKQLGAFEIERGPYENKKRGNNRYIVRKVSLARPSTGEQGPRRGQSKVHAGSTRNDESYRNDESRNGESKSKVHVDGPNSKDGNPRGPSAPEKDLKSYPLDSSEPSNLKSCDVPREVGRPLRLIVPGSADMDLVKQYEVGRKRLWRSPDGSYLLTETEYEAVSKAAADVAFAANGSGGTTAVSS